MRKSLVAAMISLAVIAGATSAQACGPNTLALLKSIEHMKEPPMFRCGTDFNNVLARFHKKDWKGALTAYEAHLANLGKWQAGSKDAVAVLAYLRKLVSSRPTP